MKSKILMTEFVTHDVKRFILEKPSGYSFVPGQATEVAIDKKGLRDEKRPFTFTSLNEDLVLEFTIKGYPEHRGMTEKLHQLKAGDHLLLDEPWGTIQYKGPGVFIAGGAGITPFIAILRDLQKKGTLAGNSLLFSNKRAEDVILEKEFRAMFKEGGLILTLSDEEAPGYHHGLIDIAFLKREVADFKQNFYLCGPPKMVDDLKVVLSGLGAEPDAVVFEN